MPVFAPFFREVNHARIQQLHDAGLSDKSIASIMNDEKKSGKKFTAAAVNGYLQITEAGSSCMLVSKASMQEILNPPPAPAPV